MAGQAQFLSLFLLLNVFGAGLAFPTNAQEKISHEEVSANIDVIVDALLPMVRRVMIEEGLDPLKMPDFTTGVLPLPGKLEGSIEFSHGWMQGLAGVKRSQHIPATYKDKRLVLELNLDWKLLDFNYEYLFKYLLIKRTGDVYGRLHDCTIRLIITVDLRNYRVSLDSMKFSRVGKLELKFEGRILDPLLNVAVKAVTKLFRQTLLNLVENRALFIFQKVFEDFNKKIPVPDRIADARPDLLL